MLDETNSGGRRFLAWCLANWYRVSWSTGISLTGPLPFLPNRGRVAPSLCFAPYRHLFAGATGAGLRRTAGRVGGDRIVVTVGQVGLVAVEVWPPAAERLDDDIGP
jgi:hypothetical protein